jgi:hypothetical protein
VDISRANPDGSSTHVTTAQTGVGGAFSFTDAPTALGSYTYTASYAADSAPARRRRPPRSRSRSPRPRSPSRHRRASSR